MAFNSYSRAFFVIAGIFSFFLYGLYEKNETANYLKNDSNYILKSLPNLSLEIIDKKRTSLHSLIGNNTKGLIVHFWATWCSPCEAELPSFVTLAKKLSGNGIRFVLVAVRDNEKKVRKFLKRFSKLPDNVLIALDSNGSSMARFGTLRVPETYIFNKQKINIKKFIGPQDWQKSFFISKILFLLRNK